MLWSFFLDLQFDFIYSQLLKKQSLISPDALMIHPYPQVLTMSRAYADAYHSIYPVRHGDLAMRGSYEARYSPIEPGQNRWG